MTESDHRWSISGVEGVRMVAAVVASGLGTGGLLRQAMVGGSGVGRIRREVAGGGGEVVRFGRCGVVRGGEVSTRRQPGGPVAVVLGDLGWFPQVGRMVCRR